MVKKKKRRRIPNRVDLHIYVQIVTHVLGALGVIIPFLFLIPVQDVKHLSSLHSVLGVLTLFGTLLYQPFTGAVEQESEQEKFYSLRRHRKFGKVVAFGSLATIATGILALESLSIDTSSLAFFFYGSIGLLSIIVLYMEYSTLLFKQAEAAAAEAAAAKED